MWYSYAIMPLMTPLGKARVSKATRDRMLAMPPEELRAISLKMVAARLAKRPPLSKQQLSSNRKAERDDLRKQCIAAYGGKCACCRESTYEFLTIDHIDGGGRQHRKVIHNFYRWLRMNNFPPGFQVLCYNCNCCKGAYGSCVHDTHTVLHIGH